MNRPTSIKVIVAAALVVFVVGGFGFKPGDPSTGTDLPSATTRFQEQMSTAAAIEFFANRVEATPEDALSATILSGLHLRRGRETGDLGEYQLAAHAAEQALRRLADHAPAHLALAKARFALHDFDAAVASAQTAADLDPTLGAEIVVADAAVATGNTERAEDIYIKLDADFDSPVLDARRAHVAELRGDYETAIEMMTGASIDAARSGYTGEPAAWFRLRLGDLHFKVGEYEIAESHYQQALEIFERYPAAEAGIAHSLAAQGRFKEAADAYERAIELQPTPSVLLSAARMYERLGLADDAERHRSTVDVIARISDGVFDLAYIHHLVDVGRTEEALQVAEGMAASRTDAYTLDALAWAQYHNGDHDTARATISRALDSGIADATVLFHAGVIHADVDNRKAIEFLEGALATSPEFDPIQAEQARAILEDLRS